MKRICLLTVVVAMTLPTFGTPADDATGADLVNAALLLQDLPGQPKDLAARFTALYLLGYIDGSIRAERWHLGDAETGHPMISLPHETDLVALAREIQDFIGNSKILGAAPAVEVLEGFLYVRHGSSPEIRKRGMNQLLAIAGEEGAKQLQAIQNKAEQGEAPDAE